MTYGKSFYGTILFGTERENANPEGNTIDLMRYMPGYYQNSNAVVNLQTAFGYSIGELADSLPDLIDQLMISTATWGLDLWEQELGLLTDQSKSYERRREIILAKLRGAGTTTAEMIQSVAMAFSGGEVSVEDYPTEYRFVVQFVGVKGIPTNMAGLITVLEEIKPAHLAYSFKYTFTTWAMVEGLTWAEAANKTWGELRIYEGDR